VQETKKADSNRIVFFQWSRKNYAIFASLQKVVNIAQLSVDICKTSLLKSNTLISLFNLSADDNIKEKDTLLEEIIDNQQFLQLLPIVAINSDITPKQEINIHYDNGKPIFCIMQSMGFQFLNQLEI
jgi:hypothetical protein